MEGMKTPAGIVWNATVMPALFVDLDGTVRHSKANYTFIEGPDDVALYPDVEAVLWDWRDRGYLIFGVSNQGGVAFGIKSPAIVMAELDATLKAFTRQPFHLVKQCFQHPEGTTFPYNRRSLCRKPDYGMLVLIEMEAWEQGYVIDWDHSLMVGDRSEDQSCALRAGIGFWWADEFFGRGHIERDDIPRD